MIGRFQRFATLGGRASRLRDQLSGGWSRRSVLAGASVGLGLAGASAPHRTAVAETGSGPELWSAEYTATKRRANGAVELAMYRRRLGAPDASEKRPVLLLVHGSSISARSSYDLVVPGRGEYSLMNVFARAGYDVWTMDHENYGKSSRTEGNADIASGVEDLRAAAPLIERETGQGRFHVLGQSSGAIRAGAFAMVEPDRVGRLVLEAFTYTGRGSPTLAKRAEALDYYRTHHVRPRGRDMIRSIMTRDKPGTSDPAVAEALADAEMVFGDTIPTGTYLDMTANLPLVDPSKVLSPVLIVRGEHDGIASLDDLMDFFKALPNPDRQFSIIAGGAHALSFSLTRERYWHVVTSFLRIPAGES